MTDPIPRRRLIPMPAWLIFGLLVVEGLLWLSERFSWFPFNHHKGWTVLIAVAVVGLAFLVMLLWFIVALVRRWRFQFSIRSLLVLTVAVAMPFSWLAVEVRETKRQVERERETATEIQKVGGSAIWSQPSGPTWLRNLLGEKVVGVELGTNPTEVAVETLKRLNHLEALVLKGDEVTDAGLKNLRGLNQLKILDLEFTGQISDAGLETLKGLKQLQGVFLLETNVTDQGIRNLQEALPNCKIENHRLPDL